MILLQMPMGLMEPGHHQADGPTWWDLQGLRAVFLIKLLAAAGKVWILIG